jgi:DNA polymerase-1
VIAHYLYTAYGDNSMRQIYLDGVDLYTTMAMQTFNLPYESCVDKAMDPTGTFSPRLLMKTGVLAYLYGQSPKAFARKMNVTDEVAEKFFAGMTSAFPGLEPFRRGVLQAMATKGNIAHSETLFGRKRRFPKYRDNRVELRSLEANARSLKSALWRLKRQIDEAKTEAEVRRAEREYDEVKAKIDRMWELRRAVSSDERQAINATIQGGAADILKQNIIALFELCESRDWKFVASIHDEAMLEVPIEDVTPEAIAEIERCMTRTVELSVPLKSDTVIQPRWADEYKPKDWFAKSKEDDDSHVA